MSEHSSATLDIWIVEDHEAYSTRLALALNRLSGIRCSGRFAAVEDALEELSETSAPRVMLLDISLPGMSGLEGLALLREKAPACAVVILTVFEDDEKIMRAIRAGAVGYLLKTATSDEIGAALRAAADGGSPMHPLVARRVLAHVAPGAPAGDDYKLSPREKEVLRLLVRGCTIKEVASKLGIGFYTADEYIRSLYKKLEVNSRPSVVAKALAEGLVEGPRE
jgi:DNA-binding NarL/FixJ family response regulator